MKKLFKNKKGFAMAELLAVSIVLLFISSILFSNYLPLVAEYENRLSYNDVTAQYAAHYIRKMYMDALEDVTEVGDTTFGDKLKATISLGIKDKGYYSVYSGGSSDIIFEQVSDKEDCERIIEQYGIEEIIITNYKLKDDKDTTNNTKYVRGNYTKDSGLLYNYINYLPNYEKSIYTGKDENSGDQLYRLILKTKDFGYATTPILSDYKTPGSCFLGKQNADNNLTITGYLYDGNECGKDVIIGKGSIEIKSAEDPSKGIKGIVVAIGDEAFKNNGNISTIQLTNKVTSIGKNAFEGSGLIGEAPDLRYVTTIGERAFANTKITKVTLSGSRTIGDEAFADNHFLSTLDINGISDDIYSDNANETFTVGLFARSGSKSTSGIKVEIPGEMKTIGAKMFYLAKINSIKLNDGIKNIDYMAFSQYENTVKKGFDMANKELIIPASVENIAYGNYQDDAGNDITKSDCFRGLGITRLVINGVGEQAPNLSIGVTAFKQNNIETLIIPSRVAEIGGSAFEDSNIKSLKFIDGKNLTTIQTRAFYGNKIEILEFPNSIVKIESYAFANNSNLTTLSLNNVSSIGERAFYNTGIKNLSIPSSVTSIKESAFNGGQLENLEIADGSEPLYISGSAFIDNSKLKNIVISARVESIKSNAFSGIAQDAEITNFSKITESKVWCNIFDANNSTCSGSMENENKMKITYMDVSNNEIRRYIYMGGATNEQ